MAKRIREICGAGHFLNRLPALLDIFAKGGAGNGTARNMAEGVAGQFVTFFEQRIEILGAKLLTQFVACVHQSIGCVEGSSSSESFQNRTTRRAGAPREIVESERNDGPAISQGRRAPVQRTQHLAPRRPQSGSYAHAGVTTIAS